MVQELLTLDACILAAGTAVGKKESEGPLGKSFDLHDDTDRFGMNTWEKSESEMQRLALNLALSKIAKKDTDLGAIFAGDLLNQCVGSAYGLLSFNTPYFGLYGACSTSCESILLASSMVSAGYYPLCAAVTSSHFCSAERQYRTPLEYGSQRTPTAQWTVTGCGAFIVGKGHGGMADILCGLPGKVVDSGIRDANNMGAAMAPAAKDTLVRFFRLSDTVPQDYSFIVTGDLGFEGGTLLCDMMRAEGYPIEDRYTDCGQLIYHRKEQDAHGGGSGCGCAASVLGAHFLPMLYNRKITKMLFMATGAMMSPDSIKQGKTIPAVAHLLELSCPEK